MRVVFVGMFRQDLKRRFGLELPGEFKVFAPAIRETGLLPEWPGSVFVFMVSGNDDVSWICTDFFRFLLVLT